MSDSVGQNVRYARARVVSFGALVHGLRETNLLVLLSDS